MFKKLRERAFQSYTDALYFLNFFIVNILTQECIALIVLQGIALLPNADLSSIPTILTVSWAELGVHTALIVWKAKAENKAKYARENVELSEYDVSIDELK